MDMHAYVHEGMCARTCERTPMLAYVRRPQLSLWGHRFGPGDAIYRYIHTYIHYAYVYTCMRRGSTCGGHWLGPRVASQERATFWGRRRRGQGCLNHVFFICEYTHTYAPMCLVYMPVIPSVSIFLSAVQANIRVFQLSCAWAIRMSRATFVWRKYWTMSERFHCFI